MNRPADSQKPSKKAAAPAPAPAPAVKKEDEEGEYNLNFLWLVLYNWISTILWFSVLGRVLVTLSTRSYEDVYDSTGWLAKWTQTVAFLEIMHSALKLVRAPLLTTIMQVSSRFLLVWIIVDNFTHLAQQSPAYSSMLVAWSVTEVVRYAYFTMALMYGAAPDWLKWLRYNTFLVLYPMGIASEVWLVWLAREPAGRIKESYAMALSAVLLIYGPGAYILFTHMLAQRRKVMKSLSEKKTQ